MMHNPHLAARPAIVALLEALLARVRAILGAQLVGMYLEGSITGDDFDDASDVDFVVVVDAELSGAQFAALQAMHDDIAALDTPWSAELEGTYIARAALRRYDPAHSLHPNIERGRGERLKLNQHDAAWLVHLAILRERGIALAGPPPSTLIDPVEPDELRAAMRAVLRGWAAHILEHPELLAGRGYQSYVVLSLCRIRYTLDTGAIASKRAAALWAQARLGPQGAALIERAWAGRQQPAQPAAPGDIRATLQLIRDALDVWAALPNE